MTDDQIIRLPELKKLSGLSRSSIYARLNRASKFFDETFPRPVPLGARAVGFSRREVEKWISERIAARDACAQRAIP